MENTDPNQKMNRSIHEMMGIAERFHGHACPGLAIGVVASKIALDYAGRSVDEELVVVVENDACGVDGIQALTGCTYGKGNLIHKDYGKSVYTFYFRTIKKAIRLSLKPDALSDPDENTEHRKELFDRVRSGIASQSELNEHNALRSKRISSILSAGEKIFEIKEVDFNPPDKARIFDSVLCAHCGEPVMATRIKELEGNKLCIPCFEAIK